MKAPNTNRKHQGISDKSLVAGFILALLLLVASSILSAVSGQTALKNAAEVSHSHKVLESIFETDSEVAKVESAARGYFLNGRPQALDEFHEETRKLGACLQDLKDLAGENSRALALIDEANGLVNARLVDLTWATELRSSKGLTGILNNPRKLEFRVHRARLTAILIDLQAVEQGLMSTRQEQEETGVALATIGIWTSNAIGLLALSGFFLLARRLVSTLRVLRQAEATRASELEERVRERTFELSAAIRDLEAFSYSVSHDLRAPLRAMSGYAGILRKDLGSRLEDGDSRLLERMQANCVKMSELIDSLLALFRVAKTELMLEEIDFSALATEVLDDVLSEFAHVTPRVSIELGMHLFGDRSMIRILIVNLLSNAVKFSSKSDSPEVSLGTTSTETGLTFYVRDNGAGFDQSQAGLLFEPFQRLHTESEFGGSGVGLAMCRKIVVRHRGEIWLESRLNQGTTVYFTIGLRQARDSTGVLAGKAAG